MSDMVKAALIIGVAIILSQGFFITERTAEGIAIIKINKFTGSSEICGRKSCYEQEFKRD